jgi:hypothetical protein
MGIQIDVLKPGNGSVSPAYDIAYAARCHEHTFVRPMQMPSAGSKVTVHYVSQDGDDFGRPSMALQEVIV